jgi:hypothetical protein
MQSRAVDPYAVNQQKHSSGSSSQSREQRHAEIYDLEHSCYEIPERGL